MNINIETLKFDPKADLTEYVKSKVSKLSRFSEKIMTADVTLKNDDSDSINSHVCEIRLIVPGNDLYAKRQCKTFEEATAETVDALKNQLEKYKAST
jgi:putative sigma-54 modulation protein